tara:strand:- start:14544 stop:14765 length:222 start_codon:yes stop_codon:yes gene_type:complete
MENNPQDIDQAKYLDNAIRAVQQKKPLPEIDFTLHTMEDGSQVSTMERVCKGTFAIQPFSFAQHCVQTGHQHP